MKFLLLLCASLVVAVPSAAEPLRVVTTLPDLADLVTQVGGEDVDALALVQGPQDPHFIEPRPSFLTRLHRADLFVQNGLELELGWASTLLARARNPKIRPGGSAHVDVSRAIQPLEVPDATLDRSAGDLHRYGNPHFLVDPLNGLRVAWLLREELSRIRPERADAFRARSDAFSRELMEHLVGTELAAAHSPEELARALESGRLDKLGTAGGWWAATGALRGRKVIQDHRVFPYLLARFGLVSLGELEPKPGIAPTSGHLARLVEIMKQEQVGLVLHSVYFDRRHADRVASETGARVVELAHQVGSIEGSNDYLSMIGENVRRLREAVDE
ncbi:MAG: zinc ABC transporter substrate-binding protein [bacterium]|nr:zinc ABC transporter substrate-binding protein [bacterium]